MEHVGEGVAYTVDARKTVEGNASGVTCSGWIGFKPRSVLFHRVYNFSIALALIVFAAPVMLVIAILLVLTQGFDIIYRGERMGQNKKPFYIYKFRTLNSEKANAITHDKVLPSGSGAETPLGGALRDTRVDELPQLFNVLLGDMNICGPRPVRSNIMKQNIGSFAGYDARFEVKPGLIGPTQAWMSHGTSKEIRSRFNAKLCRQPVRYHSETAMIILVALCVFARTTARIFTGVPKQSHKIGYVNKLVEKSLTATMTAENGNEVKVLAMNDTYISTIRTLKAGSYAIRLTLPNGQVRRTHIKIREADRLSVPGISNFKYSASSTYSEYVIDRYVLERVVVPHKSQFWMAALSRKLERLFVRSETSGSNVSVSGHRS